MRNVRFARVSGDRIRARADIDRMAAAAERELVADDMRFPLVAPYDRNPNPPAPLPITVWERFDNACAGLTWLHVSIAGAVGAIVLVASIVWSAVGGPR